MIDNYVFRLAYDRGFTLVSPGSNLFRMYLDDSGIRLYVDYDYNNYFFEYLIHGHEIKLKSQTYCNFTSKDFTDNYRNFRKEIKDYWSRRGG